MASKHGRHKDHVKDSRKKDTACSLPQFVNALKDDILYPMLQEEDTTKRKAMGKKLSEHLNQLHAMLSSRTLAREQTRRDMLKVIAPQDGNDASVAFKANLMRDNGPQLWMEHEEKLDRQLYKVTESKVRDLEAGNRMLQEALDRREAIREEVNQTYRRSKSKPKVVSKPEERIEMLESIIKRQDEELLILNKQITKDNSEYVHINKAEYDKVMNHLEPCVKKFSEIAMADAKTAKTGAQRQASQKECFKMGSSLKENILALTDYADKMRRRVHETTDGIKDLEKDKEICLQLLQGRVDVENDVELNRVVLARIKKWEDLKQDYEGEIKSLRKNIDDLAERNRELLQAYDKATATIEENNKSNPTPRKRISLPSRPKPDPVKPKVKEEDAKPIHVVASVPAKLITLGGNGATNNPAVNRRRKSSNPMTNGPMKANNKY